MLGMLSVGAMAQRATDVLDRGLVAVKTDGGIFCCVRCRLLFIKFCVHKMSYNCVLSW